MLRVTWVLPLPTNVGHDSLWTAPALQVTEAAEIPPISDHTVMMTTLKIHRATTQDSVCPWWLQKSSRPRMREPPPPLLGGRRQRQTTHGKLRSRTGTLLLCGTNGLVTLRQLCPGQGCSRDALRYPEHRPGQ